MRSARNSLSRSGFKVPGSELGTGGLLQRLTRNSEPGTGGLLLIRHSRIRHSRAVACEVQKARKRDARPVADGLEIRRQVGAVEADEVASFRRDVNPCLELQVQGS